jgi:hypothetical protein
MNISLLITRSIALALIGSAIGSSPKSAIARSFNNNSVPCYFFKGEVLEIQEVCKSDGGSWAGGGGHSLKWSDGIITRIKFGLHGRGTPVCPSTELTSVDGKCGKTYYRSNTTFKRVKNSSDDTIVCVQLDRKSVCWGRFND